MSATNTTTNYNLPIFIETDKPAWLVDFNGAMRSIDAQMKINADAIATKSPVLTFNDTSDIDFTKSGDIITANLSSGVAGTVSRALVKPVSAPASTQIASVDTSNNQQMMNIGKGLINNSGTLEAIDLNLISGTISYRNTSNATVSGTLRKAINEDKSVGKIYGAFSYSNATANTAIILTSDADIVSRPSERYEIFPIGVNMCNFNPIAYVTGVSIFVELDGSITVQFTPRTTYGYVLLFPSIFFFKNFGDIGE